ncbi:DUF4407 domain-containing protein [Spirosoma panaciterrae]|uniref:DUF4407 domain-containing protein n=1 Tax=Spirosoma panaciterrae TaxID=496058 RepID=UPI0012F72720|nr:DUF4407 domain-containing protein [Spirosoma panaciterrae]
MIGENFALIRKKPFDVTNQITRMGIALLIPVLLWFWNGFFLAHTTLRKPIGLSIATGIICSLLVYLIDRLTLMAPKASAWMKFVRLLLAMAIAVVGAIGADLIIYENDIHRKLGEMYEAKVDSVDHAFDRTDSVDRVRLTKIVTQKQVKRDSIQNLYFDEIQGRGSGRPGRADIAKAIEVQLDTARREVQRAEWAKDDFINSYDHRKAENRKRVVTENGLQLQLHLLHGLVAESWFSLLFFGCLSLIFFAMECTVLIAKSSLEKTSLEIERERAKEADRRINWTTSSTWASTSKTSV